jgi:hypothetical protein
MDWKAGTTKEDKIDAAKEREKREIMKQEKNIRKERILGKKAGWIGY